MEPNELWKLLPQAGHGGGNSKKTVESEFWEIPTIEDRIAQMAATLYIEPILDPLFHEDSKQICAGCGRKGNDDGNMTLS